MEIIINGKKLTEAQSMTIRVAIQGMAISLADNGCGDDELGKSIAKGYQARIDEINNLLAEKN